MTDEINKLKSELIGSKFTSKRTGNEGAIVDLTSTTLFIEIEYPGPVPISIKRYENFIEIDDEKKQLIEKIAKLLKQGKRGGIK